MQISLTSEIFYMVLLFFFNTFVPTLFSCLVCFISSKVDCYCGGPIKNWSMDKCVGFQCPQNSNCLTSIGKNWIFM